MKKLLSLLLSLMMMCAILPSSAETVEAVPEEAVYIEVGEGEISFELIVTDADGNAQYFHVNTNEATVGDALLALEIIAGDETEYGLYVKSVCGIVADWNVDQTYWAFFINGEYAMTGVSSTPVEAGAVYGLAVSR